MGDISKRPPILGGTLFLGQHAGPLPPFEAHSAIAAATEMGVYTGAGGVVVAAAQTALTEHNAGARGIITKYGGTIFVAAAMGFAYGGVKNLVSKERDDAISSAMGGCAAGFLTGVRTGNLTSASANCALFGAVAGLYTATGGVRPAKRPDWETLEAQRAEAVKRARDPMLDKL